MNIVVRATLISIAALSLAACKGSPEGTYKLDKAEMKKSMEADIAKMPEGEQGMAKLGVAMIEMMDITLTIKADGKVETVSTMPAFEKGAPSKKETETGEWKKDGDAIVLTSAKDKDQLKCTSASGKLTCKSDKKGSNTLVFVKS